MDNSDFINYDPAMKLLTRLRSFPSLSSRPITDSNMEKNVYEGVIINPDAIKTAEEETFGIGAAMPQDIAGMNFLDGQRRKIPEAHQIPPQHLFSREGDLALEQDI